MAYTLSPRKAWFSTGLDPAVAMGGVRGPGGRQKWTPTGGSVSVKLLVPTEALGTTAEKGWPCCHKRNMRGWGRLLPPRP